jgi:hypothetical protein
LSKRVIYKILLFSVGGLENLTVLCLSGLFGFESGQVSSTYQVFKTW